MTGYTRNDTTNNIANGNVINASDLDGEFDAIQTAFDATTGHKHDGTVGGGAPIEALGPAQDVVITTSVLRPKTDNTVDLGTSTLEFKNLYLDGTAQVDVLQVDESATVTANLTVNGNTTLGDAATDTVALTAQVSTSVVPSVDDSVDLGSATKEWKDLYLDGTANIDSLIADTADINGGTIDNATIDTSNITVGAGKTLDVSAGTLTLADNQISGNKVEGGTINAITINTLTGTTANVTDVNSTTVDTTNIEVTNIKAKDGTASATIADTTGVMTINSGVVTNLTAGGNPKLSAANPSILDTNNNEILTFAPVASAVNNLTISNGATGVAPQLRAVGDDANINLVLVPKGNSFTESVVTSTVTNTPVEVLRLSGRSSGTPAVGIGSGLTFSTETADNNNEIGAIIEAITTDVTAASEDFDLVFKLMSGGAAASEVARFTSNGNFSIPSGSVKTTSAFIETGPNTTPLNNAFVAYRAGNGVETGNPAAIRTAGDAAGNVDAMTFEVGGAERLRISADGTVNVATSFTAAGNPKLSAANPNILDTNNNEILGFAPAASAVNNLAVSNGATGVSPQLRAVGDDTNINLVLVPKGNGFAESVVTSTVTNAVIETLRLSGRSSGTPAVGIGTSLVFSTETADNNIELGAWIDSVTTDVTAASEDFDLVFRLMAGGATATERMRITSGGSVGIGTSAPAAQLEVSSSTNPAAIFTGSISGNTLNVTAVSSGTITVGSRVFGPSVEWNTIITAFGTGTGSTGTYTISNSQTVASGTMNTVSAKNSVLRLTNTDTSEQQNQTVGGIEFYGSDSSTPGAGVKGYIAMVGEDITPDYSMIFGTSDDVAGTVAVERMRISSAGVIFSNQPAPTSKSAAATLTAAELLTSIVQYTGTAANLTLPTGTSIETGTPNLPVNMSFDFSIINTGSGTATILTNTDLTLVGAMTVAAGASGIFRVRKTALNTYTVYRIS